MSNEKVLVTGCAGLLGSHIAEKLLEENYDVVGIDSLIGGYKSNIPDIKWYGINIENLVEVRKVFQHEKPSMVIHCAALPHEGLSVFSPAQIAGNIISGTLNLASSAIAVGTKKFINFSSMARYGKGPLGLGVGGRQIITMGPPFTEDMQCNPVDPYGLAKVQAEQQLNLLNEIHGLHVITVVPHNVCGPNQVYSDPYRNVMSIFANRILKDKPVYIYGDGEQKRSFSHVRDCVNSVLVLMNREDIASGEVFNIGPDNGSEITVNTLAKLVSKYCNKELSINYVPDRPREVKDAWVSTDKAKRVLQYSAKDDVEEVVRDTVSWIKDQPVRDFDYHLDLEIVTDKTPKTWTNKLFND